MSAAHPEPTRRARELVAGGYDLHVHVMPDVFPRRISDLDLAPRVREVGLGGFVLKSHYAPTAERAAVVRAATGVDVLGAVTLNSAVGGINPMAVEVCARAGGRFVWLPTFDSVNEATSANNVTATGAPPAWAVLKSELEAKGVAAGPVAVLGDGGEVLPAVRAVLRVIAEHRMVLCTGHLDDAEVLAVVDAARQEGVERIVITHPDFPSQRFSVEAQRRLAERGCLLERCFGTPYAGRIPWEVMFANIREAGVAASVVSGDLGQPHNPPVEDALALMADRMLEAGFSDDEVHTMTVVNSRSLAAAPLPAAAVDPAGARAR